MYRSSLKALVTSDKDFQVFHAVFFPLPEKADTVSHPVKARKTRSVRHCVGVIVAAISSIAMYQMLDLTPKETHSSSGAILQNERTANTTTSISTVRMVTFLYTPLVQHLPRAEVHVVKCWPCLVNKGQSGPSMTQQGSRGLYFHLLHKFLSLFLQKDKQLHITGK